MDEIKIQLNDSLIKIKKGATLASILSEVNAYHLDGTIIGIGQSGKGLVDKKPKFKISTNKGDVVFEVHFKGGKEIVFDGIVGSDAKLVNVSPRAISIGPFPFFTDCKYQEYEMSEGDVALDYAGHESDNACLIMCKGKHRAFYSLASPIPLGRVLSGKETLLHLTPEDHILGISRLPPSVHMRRASLSKVKDLDIKIQKEGTWIQTYASAKMGDTTPESGELFLREVKVGAIACKAETSSFLMSDGARGFRITERNSLDRKRGTISIRNAGKNSGQFYYYKRNRQGANSHTVIGEIIQGMELLELGKLGDTISLLTEPRVIDCVGMTQTEAYGHLSTLDLKQSRKGDAGDNAIVVKQIPSSALKMGQDRIIETVGLMKENLIPVQLFEDRAPSSVRFFRAVTGLTYGSIGALHISLNYSKLAGSIFVEGDIRNADEPDLDPENVPTGLVSSGFIGITNSVVTRMGTIGIRLDESGEFGPTCENLESTNIMGKVLGNSQEQLKKCNKDQIVYIEEVSRFPNNSP